MQILSSYQSFSIEEKMIHHLMLQAYPLTRIGLLYGKLGVAIAFAECGKYLNNPIYTDIAKELKNSILKKIKKNLPLDFATGLSGIGWGIEYMDKYQFADRTEDEVCEIIDQRIMEVNMRRLTDFSLKSGLEGFLHYILIRLNGVIIRNISNPFDDTFLKDIYDRIQSFPKSDLNHAFICFIDTEALTYKPNISLFINDLEIKSEEDILSAKLGLCDGLAGKIIIMVSCQKSFQL